MMMNIFQRESRKDAHRVAYEEPLYTLSELYHEASKIDEQISLSYRHHLARIMGTEFFLKLMSKPYKTYPTAEVTGLPSAEGLEDTPLSSGLREAVFKRRSVREFSGQPVSLNNIANIISNASSVTMKMVHKTGVEEKRRAAPSGGALYPLELYVASFKVNSLPPGIYHYNVEAHSLELVRAGQFNTELGRAVFFEDMFKTVSAMFIITGVLRRSSIKYGERAYRFMMIEAGHVGQNITLTAVALNLGCVMLGGFCDDDIDEIIGADGASETTLYTAAVGAID